MTVEQLVKALAYLQGWTGESEVYVGGFKRRRVIGVVLTDHGVRLKLEDRRTEP